MSDRKDPEKLAAENRDDNPENNGKTSLSPPDASEYEAKLGSRLLFKARIDSKDPVHDRIHVWLELLEGGGSLELPPRVMVELACGTNSLHVLASLRDRYKGSSRKRSLAV